MFNTTPAPHNRQMYANHKYRLHVLAINPKHNYCFDSVFKRIIFGGNPFTFDKFKKSSSFVTIDEMIRQSISIFQYLLPELVSYYCQRECILQNSVSGFQLNATIYLHLTAILYYAAIIFIIDSRLAAKARAASICSLISEG